jgi:hypothetical protein
MDIEKAEEMIREAALGCDADDTFTAFVEGAKWMLYLLSRDERGGYEFNIVHYRDPWSGSECDMFVVTDGNGNKVYERDYGSTGTGFTEYVEDYFRYINGIGYQSDTSGFSGFNTTETGY